MSRSVFVAGHKGLVGSAIVRRLVKSAEYEVITEDRSKLDLRDPDKTHRFLKKRKPDSVIVAAGVVGGIRANRSRPVDFLSDNALIALNTINGAFRAEVNKLIYLSSNCIYPRDATPPYQVEMIGQAAMEPTNQSYGSAKLLGMKLCESYQQQYGCNYFSVVPTNTFGPGDSLNESEGHVISDLILKSFRLSRDAADSKILKLWGTGSAVREFLYIDDLADALCFLHDSYRGQKPINIGGGEVLSVRDLAGQIIDAIDATIQLEFDTSQPDGAPVRVLDNSELSSLGWRPTTGFDYGLSQTITWYRSQRRDSR